MKTQYCLTLKHVLFLILYFSLFSNYSFAQKLNNDSLKLTEKYRQDSQKRYEIAKNKFLNIKKNKQSDSTYNIKVEQLDTVKSNYLAKLPKGSLQNVMATYNYGYININSYELPPGSIYFRITKPNTPVRLSMYFYQNKDDGYFSVEMWGNSSYNITSYDLNDYCTGRFYYEYEEIITLQPGEYGIRLDHSNYYDCYPNYSFDGSLSFDIIEPGIGDTFEEPFNIGNFTDDFHYSDYQMVTSYPIPYSNNKYYKFTTTKSMEVTLGHCGTTVTNTEINLLDVEGSNIGSCGYYLNDDPCSGTEDSFIKKKIVAGTYYIVSSGFENDDYGDIKTNISGIILPGYSIERPVVAGSFSENFQYTSTKNSMLYANVYGKPSNEIYYKFTLTQKMLVTATHCGSGINDTYMYLLDSSGMLLTENDNYNGDGQCHSPDNSFIQRELESGTYYIVSEGNSDNGEITTNITGFITEFDYPDFPNEYSSEQEIVGSLSGSFDVSSTGAAIYNIPIECPVGVGGLQPSLSLSYNSQSGNGLVGWGTNLSGISAITRGLKNIYYDGEAKAKTYTGDDAYYLDGQRLIYSSGIVGQEGSIYYLESDPFTKITVHGTYNGTICNTWFEMDKDGIKYQFGRNSDSRQLLSGNKINAWYLDHVKDLSGNYIDYSYYNSYGYHVHLKEIIYGKNKNESNSLENKITLAYAGRPDVIPFVIHGNQGSIYNYLSKITISTNNTKYREYELKYTNSDHFSRLASVTVKNTDDESMKPTILHWDYLPSFTQDGRSTFVENNALVIQDQATPFEDQEFYSADLNGDGISDLISIFPVKLPGNNEHMYAKIRWGALDSQGNPQFSTSSDYSLGMNFTVDDWRGRLERTNGAFPIDFDGDGLLDIIIPHETRINGTETKVRFHSLNQYRINEVYEHTLPYYGSSMPTYAIGDIDNDGRGEVVILDRDGHYIGGSSAVSYPLTIFGDMTDGIWNEAKTYISLPSEAQKVYVSDFNSDGLNDILILYNGGYTIVWNQGNGMTRETFSDNNKYVGNTIENAWKIVPGDFNGDGLVDFLISSTMTNRWDVAFNNGDGTFYRRRAFDLEIYDQDFTSKDDDKFECNVFDFDYDGKSDVVITKAMYDKKSSWGSTWGEFKKTYTYWMSSNGSHFTKRAEAISDKEEDATAKFYLTGDFNGDGRIELINYGYTSCFNGQSGSKAWRLYRNPNMKNSSGMVKAIETGLIKTDINYTPLTDKSIYTKGEDSTYPVNDITIPMAAVRSVSSENGVAGSTKVNYSYSGAKIHLHGKGFLGMTSTKATDQETGIVKESGIRDFDYTFYIPTETYTKTTIDGVSSETNIRLTVVDKGAHKYFAYPSQKTEKDIYGNIYTSTYKYNADYGYITEEKTEFGTSNMYQLKQYGEYILAGGVYKPQLLTTTQKHADDTQGYTNRTRITYNQAKGYPLSKVENEGTPLALTTQYRGYDSFGNLTSYEISGSGLNTMKYYTEYDATKRFIVKKHTLPASTVSAYTYDLWGNMLTETDETNISNLLTITHTYNKWGIKTSTILPDGNKTKYSSGWNYDPNKRYFTLVQGNGQPWVKTWYDQTGREVLVESIGAKSLRISTNKSYNSKGELVQVENRQGDLTTRENFDYDARGQLISESSSSGKTIRYTYGNRTKTTIDNERSFTKTFDAWGNIKSSSDPVSSVSYTYYSNGKPKAATSGGSTSTMTYDAVGNQTSITDPNTGTITYTYDAGGKLLTQKDGRGNILTNTYDLLNRLSYSILTGTSSESPSPATVRTDYTYGTSGYEQNQLLQVKTGNNYIGYIYDEYGRVITEKQNIEGEGLLEFYYTYNSAGHLETKSYKNGPIVKNIYDTYGNLINVMVGTQPIWELTANTGTSVGTLRGGTLATTSTLNNKGYLSNLKTVKGNTILHNMDFVFDGSTGNLTSRTGMIDQKETFYYDNLDRLTDVKHGTAATIAQSIGYVANGNISSKTGLGAYEYHPAKKHAMTDVANTDNLLSTEEQTITYTAFNKAGCLKDKVGSDNYQLDIHYGTDQQRWKTVLKKNNTVVRTAIFAGDYEKITSSGITQHLYYISGGNGLAAIYVKQPGQSDKIYYPNTDHQGSIVSMTDGSGATVFKARYDAWGKQTITNNSFKFHRGYTGHEHLPEFGLINMNGRMYDPVVGRFLSPDPYVQAPDFSQNYNRYSYCLNNPLKYTDPSGELFGFFTGLIKGTFDFWKGLGKWAFDGGNFKNDVIGAYKPAWNGLEMDVGLFIGSPKQILSRWTWELPQTLSGYIIGTTHNALGGVKSVGYWGGATVIESYSNTGAIPLFGGGDGVTMGSFIIGQRGIKADPKNALFQHEYGHYLQSQAYGWAFLPKFGIPSMISAGKKDGKHDYRAFEQDANSRALEYFTEEVDWHFAEKSWDFSENPIVGYNVGKSFYSRENQAAIGNARISFNGLDLMSWNPLFFWTGFIYNNKYEKNFKK